METAKQTQISDSQNQRINSETTVNSLTKHNQEYQDFNELDSQNLTKLEENLNEFQEKMLELFKDVK